METRLPWNVVSETASFSADADGLLTDEERREFGNMLAQNPTCGKTMGGTGGVRKVRVALQGRGKSGGARVIYYFHNASIPIYLIAIFAKNEKDNLSASEKAAMRKFVTETVKNYEQRKEK